MRKVETFGKEMQDISDRLVDDISKDLFDARIKNLIYRNIDAYRNDILSIYENYGIEWQILQLDKEVASHPNLPGIVIFGCGINGLQVLRLIENSKHKDIPVYFCDNDNRKWNTMISGRRVISTHELFDECRSYLCIIGSGKYRQVLFEQLIFEGFPKENILYPNLGYLYGVSGWQYFDYFKPQKEEVFIDGGVFDGETSGDFAKWSGDKYEKIIGFEANPYVAEKCRNYCLYIYGAGVLSRKFIMEILPQDIRLKGVLVSDGEPCKESFYGIEVKRLSEISDNDNAYIFVTVGEDYAPDIIRNLKDEGYGDYWWVYEDVFAPN